jgi:hypothetical protein
MANGSQAVPLYVYGEQQSKNTPASVGQQFPSKSSGAHSTFPLHVASAALVAVVSVVAVMTASDFEEEISS